MYSRTAQLRIDPLPHDPSFANERIVYMLCGAGWGARAALFAEKLAERVADLPRRARRRCRDDPGRAP